MKRTLVILVLALVLVFAVAVPAGAATHGRLACASHPRLVTSFEPGAMGSFAESLAADRHGNLFASLTVWGDSDIGQIWKIARNGHKTLAASLDLGPTGMLTGLAFDRRGRLYVGLADFADPSVATPGVLRVTSAHSLTRVLTLPGGSFPNGLAFHEGWLYVSDSSLGAVWRVRPVGQTLSQPWLQNDLLLPGANGIGANGIAFWRDRLFIAVSDAGRLVRVRVGHHGSHGALVIVKERPDLLTSVDGIAFDATGGLWMVTNANALVRLAPKGALRQVAIASTWLDYPTMPVFGTASWSRHTLYIANGSFNNGAPNVIALRVGVRAAPERR